MSSTKRTFSYGVAAAIESTYGTAATIDPAQDGILVVARPDFVPTPVHDGSRNGAFGFGGATPRVAPSGFAGEVTLEVEATGAGASYSATVLPPIARLLRACGFAQTVNVGTSVVYAPVADSVVPASLTLATYARGQNAQLTGVYGDFSISADGPVVPKWDFRMMGMVPADPTDGNIPAGFTVPNFAILPPKATNLALTINGVGTLRVRGFTYTHNRVLAARVDDNSTGHAGFTPGGRTPTFEVTVETPALATLNPYALRRAATAMAISMTVGATQFNRWSLAMAAAKLVDISDGEDGPSATTTLSFVAEPTTAGGVDDVTITFN
jgi:hypothetical protein